jgi:DNA-binding transcriptional LysR family regulator
MSDRLRPNCGALGRVRVRARNTLALQVAVAAGAGIAVLPDYLAGEGLTALTPAPVLHRDVWLVFHRAMREVARVRAVARFVALCLERFSPR